jgi:transcriptional regulator with XRE-family HTH domain
MSISEVLKQARSESELSQEEVAERVGVSRQTVSSWENGKSYPDIANVIALSDVFGMTLDSFLKDDTKMIMYLEKSTNVTRSNKQVIASIIAFGVFLLGIALVIVAFGGDFDDFGHLPAWLAVLIPLVFMLTITRSFKMFVTGLRGALFPKKEMPEETRRQAAALFRLLTKTAVIAAIISALISLLIILDNLYIHSEYLSGIMGDNLYNTVRAPLYSLFLILVVFEPVTYILTHRSRNSVHPKERFQNENR